MNDSRDNADTDAEAFRFSLVRDDFLFRLQRRVGLIPANGLGVVRRAIFWALFAWLPIALLTWHAGRILPGTLGEPLLGHFGIQVRFLIAIPLFIVAEGVAQSLTTKLLPYFVESGLVATDDLPRFRAAIAATARLRSASLPLIVIVALVIAFMTATQLTQDLHQVSWALEGEGTAVHLDFGGWWFLYVGRPIFLTLLLSWLWRVALLFMLLSRIARLPLAIVPTHPDRAGGLGFLARFPNMFVPVVLAISSVLASGWAHDVVYHSAHVTTLRWEMAAFVVLVLSVFLSPLLVFAGPLGRAKKQGLLQYGALVGRHGRLVREKWIDGKPTHEAALLDAPELGPVADTEAIYDAVTKMRPVPLSKTAVAPLLLAAVAPMIAVLAIEVPVVEILKKLLTSLI